MKMIKLLDSAYVGGELHHPHDGVLEVTDAEAKRLTGENMAEDVTEDFTAEQVEEEPAIAEASIGEGADTPPETKSARRKGAAPQE